MKQCPKCRSTYTDDDLRFCLTDGTRLAATPDENETQVAGRGATVRVGMPSDRPESTVGNAQPRSSVGKIILLGGLVGLLLILVTGLIGALAYFGLRDRSSDNRAGNDRAIPSPTASPTSDNEKQRLQDELANIQKRLAQDEKNANHVAAQPTPNSSGTVSARVNSPNDGFLALRSQPNSTSELIVKIPHGDTITIENCNRNKVALGGRAGRWCLISWNGYQGYVFDAWLIY